MTDALLSEISRLSAEQVLLLSSDDSAFELFFNSLPDVKNRRALNDDIQRGNEELAAANLTMKSEIEKIKQDIADLSSVLEAQNHELQDKLHQQTQLKQRNSPEQLKQRLQEAVTQAEVTSDKTAEAFHEGKIDAKTFLTDYTEQRVLYHMRRAKLEHFDTNMAAGGLP
eukprot:RCo036064